MRKRLAQRDDSRRSVLSLRCWRHPITSTGPLLPKWGSFGKSADEIAKLEERIRDDGDKQAAITRQLAELGLRAQAMVVRPMQWFGCAAFASSNPAFPAACEGPGCGAHPQNSPRDHLPQESIDLYKPPNHSPPRF